MPNNNPQGHNQYTRPELRSQRTRKPVVPPEAAPHTDSPAEHEAPRDQGTQGAQDPDPGHRGSSADAGSGIMVEPPAPPVRAPSGTSRRGFASMDAALQREIASKGGHSQGRANNPGNFANDRARAREAGRKGGEAHGHR